MGTLTRLRFLINESEMEGWEKKYWLDSIPNMSIDACKNLLAIQEKEYKSIQDAIDLYQRKVEILKKDLKK